MYIYIHLRYLYNVLVYIYPYEFVMCIYIRIHWLSATVNYNFLCSKHMSCIGNYVAQLSGYLVLCFPAITFHLAIKYKAPTRGGKQVSITRAIIRVCMQMLPDCIKTVPVEKLHFLPIELALLTEKC
jgi:hypothetical protein